MIPWLPSVLQCAQCSRPLDERQGGFGCRACGQHYPRVGRVPVLLPYPEDHVRLWRQQLAAVIAQGEYTRAALDGEFEHAAQLQSGPSRLRALQQALRQQLADIAAVVSPALGGPLAAADSNRLPRGVVEYSHFCYRDWAWETAGNTENRRAHQAVRAVLGEAPLGRLLVLGAGACRLAYDLHRAPGASETVALDIDPFLLLIAESVLRGESVHLTEATANVQELNQVAQRWELCAPGGPLHEREFQCLLADGLAPPFADGSFDTVLAPWFIDQVPADLPGLLSQIHRVLRPMGRLIHTGPLLFPAVTPFSSRYCREEVFELLARAGFELGAWATETHEHLVSPLTGRGRVEWVLTFEARAVVGSAARHERSADPLGK